MPPNQRLTVPFWYFVIPAYNEEGAITEGIREVIAVMDSSGIKYELLVVDDGSPGQHRGVGWCRRR